MKLFKFGDPVWAWTDVTKPAVKGFFYKYPDVGDDRPYSYGVMTGLSEGCGELLYDYYDNCTIRRLEDLHAPMLPFGTHVYKIYASNGLVYDFGVYAGPCVDNKGSHRIFVDDGACGRVVEAFQFTTENC